MDEAVAVVAIIVAASIPDSVIGILLVLVFAVAWPDALTRRYQAGLARWTIPL